RAVGLQRALRELLGGLARAALQVRGMHDLVHEAHLLGAASVELLAREDEIERVGETDETRGALRAAGAGDEAELNLGEADLRGLRLGRDAVAATERELEAAAEAGAVDRGD